MEPDEALPVQQPPCRCQPVFVTIGRKDCESYILTCGRVPFLSGVIRWSIGRHWIKDCDLGLTDSEHELWFNLLEQAVDSARGHSTSHRAEPHNPPTPMTIKPFLRPSLASIFLAAAATFIALPSAEAIIIPTENDALVSEVSGATNNNYGRYPDLIVIGTTSNRRYSYLKFDVAPGHFLPSGTTANDVSRAIIYLYVNNAPAAGDIDIFTVNASWIEGTKSSATESNSLSWNLQPSFDTSAVGTIPTASIKGGEYLSIDVTDLVKGWITNSNNNGLLFKAQATTTQVYFDAKENADASHAPLLEVTLASQTSAPLSAISAGTWTGANSITTLGTVTAGTWNGSTIALANGGTGSTTGSITGSGALTFASGGTNTSVTLTPTGTGLVVLSSDAAINGLTVGRGAGGVLSNTMLGYNTLLANTTGAFNTATGYIAFSANTTGYENTVTGYGALGNSTTGYYNTALGSLALRHNTTGNGNTAIGRQSLFRNLTGSSNVALGDGAGAYQANGASFLQTPVGSIYIGAGTRGFDDNDNGSIVIGYGAIGEGANTTVIGSSSTTATHSFGSLTVGGGTAAPELRLLEASGSGTNYTGFKAPTLSANVIYTLPAADGTSGQVLATNGSGVLSWVATASNISGNAGTATALQTPRTINGVAFDGTSNITVNAAAGGLTGATLNSGVISSSLTSLGTVTSGTWQATAVADSYIASASTWHAKQDALTFGAGLTNTVGTITIGGGAITNSMLAGSIDLTSKVTGALPAANGGTGQTSVLASADAFDAKGSDLASASTTDLSTATGVFVNVTGTATIAALGTAPAGVRRWVRFTGAGTITYHATSLILPGAADLTRAVGDCAIFESLGSGNWRCLFYQRAEGAPIGLRIQPQGDVAMDFHAGPTP